jgi:hypothetical protein
LNTGLNGALEQCNAPLVSNFAIVGIEFRSAYVGTGTNPPTGINVVCGKRAVDWLIEDVVIKNYKFGIVLQGSSGARNQNIAVRRSQILNSGVVALSESENSGSGMYVTYLDGLLLEENFLYHNGWKEPGVKTTYGHGLYLDNEGNDNFIVRNNIVADSANAGIQLRNGGIASDNLFIGNRVNVFGGGDSWAASPNVHVDVRDNVFLNGVNTWATVFENIEAGSFSQNIIAHNDVAIALYIDAASSDKGKKVKNLHITDNVIYNSGKPGNDVVLFGGIKSSGSILENIKFSSNDIQLRNVSPQQVTSLQDGLFVPAISSSNNRFYAPTSQNQWFKVGSAVTDLVGWKSLVGDTSSVALQASYPEPNRNTASYMSSLGYSNTSYVNFIAKLKEQSKDAWKPEFTAGRINDYIRAGFGK